jgi:hypothetical protein
VIYDLLFSRLGIGRRHLLRKLYGSTDVIEYSLFAFFVSHSLEA